MRLSRVSRPLAAVAAVIAAGLGGTMVLGGQPLADAMNLLPTGASSPTADLSDGAPAPSISPNPSRQGSPSPAVTTPAVSASPTVTATPTPTPTATPTVPSLGQLSLEDRQAWASQDYSVHSGALGKSKKVILTYDDCPNDWDKFEKMVVGAQQMGVSIAMFATGECANNGYFDSKFARDHGHYVFNHSNTHPHLGAVSREQALQELGGAGIVSSWGRPPFGDYTRDIVDLYEAKGMRLWLWDIDTLDWTGKSQSEVVDYVVSNSYPGATVLMHMQYSAFNPSALAQMKAGLAKGGMQLCANKGPTEQFPRQMNC